MENPLQDLYAKMDADETLVLCSAASNDSWRIYEKEGALRPFYWC
jgi:hypothetical protein